MATDGKPGEVCRLELELKLIADVGFTGLPNAGKSTLIFRMTDRSVKIAAYPFTTLRPNLACVLTDEEEPLVIADIPGIIAGASRNKGLGFEFLRHIERTSLLLFVIDVSIQEGRDPLEDFATLQKEMRLYNPKLLEKPFGIALNKIDLGATSEAIQIFREKYPYETFEISALTGQGVEELIGFLKRKLSK